MKYLLDSNIIIYYLNGDIDIYKFIEKYKSISAISLITYYEVLNYNFSEKEELLVKKFLNEFEILSVSKNIINKALENRKSKKIKMADNFILATAQIFGLEIVTRNIKDFSTFTDKLLNPFLQFLHSLTVWERGRKKPSNKKYTNWEISKTKNSS